MESPPLNTSRYPALDYLRGWMALAVMGFHFDKWLSGSWNAALPLGRMGVYAVSVFFVLSGLTLSLVYENRLDARLPTWISFYRKRAFRIFPLLWLATLATLILDDFARPASTILLNFSGLFGFVNPARDIATGAWSIGCELVFYAAFPTLLIGSRRNPALLWLSFAGVLGLGVWIAFAWFSLDKTDQAEWWEAYVQVANHAFFFVAGVCIAAARERLYKIRKPIWLGIMLLSGALFAFWPVGTNPFQLIYGWNRLVFSGLSLVFVMAWFGARLEFKGLVHRILSWLGAISYAVYLLHPLVFRTLRALSLKFGIEGAYWPILWVALALTLILSHLSYYWLEKPLLKRA